MTLSIQWYVFTTFRLIEISVWRLTISFERCNITGLRKVKQIVIVTKGTITHTWTHVLVSALGSVFFLTSNEFSMMILDLGLSRSMDGIELLKKSKERNNPWLVCYHTHRKGLRLNRQNRRFMNAGRWWLPSLRPFDKLMALAKIEKCMELPLGTSTSSLNRS